MCASIEEDVWSDEDAFADYDRSVVVDFETMREIAVRFMGTDRRFDVTGWWGIEKERKGLVKGGGKRLTPY